MPRKRQIIQLSETEQSSLTKILSRGKSSAHEQRRARVLNLLNRGEHPKQLAKVLQVGIATVYNIQKRYLEEGFRSALTDAPALRETARYQAGSESKNNRSCLFGVARRTCSLDFAVAR
jgi:DNA-binding CsgD family transcriptional regulator